MPDANVTIAFDLSANGIGDYFTLDNATKGVLNNATYFYAGDVAVDVTEYVKKISTRRGRSKQLEKFTSGSSTITLDNRTRVFDPTVGTAISPFAGQIEPNKAVTVSVAGHSVYSGLIQDWNLSYSPDGQSEAEISCADPFALLAQTIVAAGTATSQKTGARIASQLQALGFGGGTAIATGQATLIGDVIKEDQNGLQYLQKIESSEPGAFFAAKDGTLIFRDRLATQSWNGIVFADDGSGIPFVELEVEYGTEQLYTSVQVTRSNGTATVGTAIAVNTLSKSTYGNTTLNVDTLLSTDAQMSDLASFLLGRFDSPKYRITKLVTIVDALTSTQAGQILELELADVVEFVFTPNNIGTQIVQFLVIDQIEHEITPELHKVTLQVSETQVAFVLNDPIFGVLDENIYGF